jgi:hypothetical protein
MKVVTYIFKHRLLNPWYRDFLLKLIVSQVAMKLFYFMGKDLKSRRFANPKVDPKRFVTMKLVSIHSWENII